MFDKLPVLLQSLNNLFLSYLTQNDLQISLKITLFYLSRMYITCATRGVDMLKKIRVYRRYKRQCETRDFANPETSIHQHLRHGNGSEQWTFVLHNL